MVLLRPTRHAVRTLLRLKQVPPLACTPQAHRILVGPGRLPSLMLQQLPLRSLPHLQVAAYIVLHALLMVPLLSVRRRPMQPLQPPMIHPLSGKHHARQALRRHHPTQNERLQLLLRSVQRRTLIRRLLRRPVSAVRVRRSLRRPRTLQRQQQLLLGKGPCRLVVMECVHLPPNTTLAHRLPPPLPRLL